MLTKKMTAKGEKEELNKLKKEGGVHSKLNIKCSCPIHVYKEKFGLRLYVLRTYLLIVFNEVASSKALERTCIM